MFTKKKLPKRGKKGYIGNIYSSFQFIEVHINQWEIGNHLQNTINSRTSGGEDDSLPHIPPKTKALTAGGTQNAA
jgi:hypothetical protein